MLGRRGRLQNQQHARGGEGEGNGVGYGDVMIIAFAGKRHRGSSELLLDLTICRNWLCEIIAVVPCANDKTFCLVYAFCSVFYTECAVVDVDEDVVMFPPPSPRIRVAICKLRLIIACHVSVDVRIASH